MILTQRSIFFKIYTGLLLICLLAMVFGYSLLVAINEVRVRHYREMATFGAFYLIESELNRRAPSQRQAWLNKTGQLFGNDFGVVSKQAFELKVKEARRLQNHQPVVRDLGRGAGFDVLYQTTALDDEVLHLKIDQIGDKQVRALSLLLLEELSNYPSLAAKKLRLEELSRRLGYPVQVIKLNALDIDPHQRLRLDGGETVLVFYDGALTQNSSVMAITRLGLGDEALVVGPIMLFYWAPASLLWSVAILALLIIAMGLYMLIYPLEKRLKALQYGVDAVAAGRLDTKVTVVGEDDIARLATTFNAMTAHIKRLIDSQRELTRAVSHELRTPVARIRFAIEMLTDDDDFESREAQRQEIDADIEALNELIDEMLTYAKLEEGSPKLDWQLVNLRELVQQVVKETNALGKPITVNYNFPTDKTRVMADKRYLHRVLQNFAGNALRYAKTTIMISAWTDGGLAFVSVEDDGQGIAKEHRQKVFAPFARLDDSRTQATGGYGLGLSIVSRIAFWFQGQVKAGESPTLGGARFVMSWPVRQVGVTILGDEDVQEKSLAKTIGTGTIRS